MKTVKQISILWLLIATFSNAQVMVISQNKVNDTKEYYELAEKYWYPVFDKLVDDGKLDEVGALSHSWGDEWNAVGYYKAKDFASFEKAFNEGYEKWKETTPEEVRKKISKMIVEHKDNIYQIKHSHSGK
jgi:hypothetical protein